MQESYVLGSVPSHVEPIMWHIRLQRTAMPRPYRQADGLIPDAASIMIRERRSSEILGECDIAGDAR